MNINFDKLNKKNVIAVTVGLIIVVITGIVTDYLSSVCLNKSL
jgi:hypothetical protein